jgi:hypothetical protein
MSQKSNEQEEPMSKRKKSVGFGFEIVTDEEDNRRWQARVVESLERELAQCSDPRRAASLERDIAHRRKYVSQ